MNSMIRRFWRVGIRVLVLVMLFSFGAAGVTRAQLNPKWLDVGSLHDFYLKTGVAVLAHDVAYGGAYYTGMQWPALYPYMDHQNVGVIFLGAKDFTNAEGEHYPVKVVTQKFIYSAFGRGGIYPVEHKLVARLGDPLITVDGAETFAHANFVDEVDPTLPADRMLVQVFNTQLGITIRRRVMAWSQKYHDNYHIEEITLINTGNVDTDSEIELPNTTLKGVRFGRFWWSAVGKLGNMMEGGSSNHGRYDLNDAIGFGARDFEEQLGPAYRGVFAWDPNDPHFTKWDDVGAPILEANTSVIADADTTGRIASPGFYGRLVVHADRSVDDPTDDPAQPSTIAWLPGNNDLLSGENPYNGQLMRREYELISQGRETPHHADVVTPPKPGESWIEQMARQTADPSLGPSAGQHELLGYGPYTLAPGDSVTFVVANAVAGLDRQATVAIGKAFKEAHLDGKDDRPIEYDADHDGTIEGDEVMSKTQWVLTGKDSLFQTYRRAMANYRSGYEIPRDPMPPKEFHITSGVGKITLTWDTYPEANPQGFEIWRASGPRSLWDFKKIATLGPEARKYEDTDVVRGIGYYYHILAVGEVNRVPTGETPTGKPLKSSLYYTQTYNPAFLRRPPGQGLSAARVVPNPYDLGANENVRWPDVQDRLGFLNIPGKCTIRIYTEMGELVRTLEHTDGSGDEFWDLTTSSNQLVVSGIYIAVIEDHETGEQIIRKFVVIR